MHFGSHLHREVNIPSFKQDTLCSGKKKEHLAQNIYKEAKDEIIFISDPPHLLKKLRYVVGICEVRLELIVLYNYKQISMRQFLKQNKGILLVCVLMGSWWKSPKIKVFE